MLLRTRLTAVSTPYTKTEIIRHATSTIMVESRSSSFVGHVTLFISLYTSEKKVIIFSFIELYQYNEVKCCTCGGTRTPNQRFWRPLLYQLSYTRTKKLFCFFVSLMFVTTLAIFSIFNSTSLFLFVFGSRIISFFANRTF